MRSVELLSAVVATAFAGKADISSANLRGGVALDNIKAAWDKELVLKGHSTKLQVSYDLREKQSFLSSISLSGAVSPPTAPYIGKVKMGYDLSHSFCTMRQALKLSAAAKGATIKAALDAKGAKLTEVAAASRVDIVGIKPSFKPPSSLLELKLEAYGAAATFGYKLKSRAFGYKLEASHELAAGRDLEAELQADGVELSFSDSTLEKGATWIATLSTPFSAPLSDSEMVIRRSMSF